MKNKNQYITIGVFFIVVSVILAIADFFAVSSALVHIARGISAGIGIILMFLMGLSALEQASEDQ